MLANASVLRHNITRNIRSNRYRSFILFVKRLEELLLFDVLRGKTEGYFFEQEFEGIIRVQLAAPVP